METPGQFSVAINTHRKAFRFDFPPMARSSVIIDMDNHRTADAPQLLGQLKRRQDRSNDDSMTLRAGSVIKTSSVDASGLQGATESVDTVRA